MTNTGAAFLTVRDRRPGTGSLKLHRLLERDFEAMEAEIFFSEIRAELESGKLVLPTLPDIALRVNDVAENPNASLAELADVIIGDAALAAPLIRIANSPLYRGREPVDNVQMAVSRLGLKLVKNVISSLVMEQMFQTPSAQLEDRFQALWRHSSDVAATSYVLASKQPGVSPDEAMLAGLIHNIGVLPILLKAEQWPELLQNTPLLDSIICELGTQIGVVILENWGFPESLVRVVAEHEDYERDSVDGPDLIDIVQVANLQSQFNPRMIATEVDIAALPSFRKLGIQTEVQVEELEENSEDYAAALAFFGQR